MKTDCEVYITAFPPLQGLGAWSNMFYVGSLVLPRVASCCCRLPTIILSERFDSLLSVQLV